MGETHVLTTPVQAAATTGYVIRYVLMYWDDAFVEICVRPVGGGQPLVKRYDETTTPTGAAIMLGLNKANLSTLSLHRRILERLAADGVIGPGAIVGVPD